MSSPLPALCRALLMAWFLPLLASLQVGMAGAANAADASASAATTPTTATVSLSSTMLATGILSAPPPGTPVRPVRSRWSQLADPVFTHFGIDQGVPHQLVMALAQDRSGFLWLGTQGGLARWDGYRFQSYNPEPGNPHSLPDNSIQSLHVDQRGQLWIGTSGSGLVRHDAMTDRFVRLPVGSEGVGHISVFAMCNDGGDGIWVGTRAGVDHLRPRAGMAHQAVLHLRHDPANPASLPSDEVRSLLRDGKGRLWIGTRKGLVWRDENNGKLHAVPLPGSSAAPPIRVLQLDADGQIWVGSIGQGVFVIDPQSLQVKQLQDAQGMPVLVDLASIEDDGHGQVWLGTYAYGMLVFDRFSHEIRHLQHDPALLHGLTGNTVTAMLRDRSGLLWLATQRGLSRYDPGQGGVSTVFGQANHPGRIADPDVRSILPLHDGSVLLGLQAQGISVIDRDRRRIDSSASYPARPEVVIPLIRASAQLDATHVYLGTDRGLFHTDPAVRTLRHLVLPPLDPGRIIFSLLPDAGKMWLGGGDGLWLTDPQAASASRVEGTAVLNDEPVTALTLAADGKLWIGTRTRGLFRYDPRSHQIDHFPPQSGKPSAMSGGNIATLLIDSRGWLWIGTQGGGINLLQDTAVKRPQDARFVRYGVAHGLPNALVNQLLEDRHGRIWASTDRGLAMIDKNGHITALQRADGVAIPYYWSNSGARLANGELLFGGAGGLTVVQPELLREWRFTPPVVVSAISVGGKPVPVGAYNWHDGGTPDPLSGKLREDAPPLLLQPDANSISVEFSALDFSAPERNRYAYWLEGYDHDWTETGSQRRLAAYTNLPPGQYRLRLRGSNRNGVWNPQELILPVKVLPSWLQSGWLRAMLAVAAMLAVWGLVQVRTRYLRQHQRELQQEVDTRTRELSEKQGELLTANQGLQAAIVAANRSNDALNQTLKTLSETQAQLVQQAKIASLGTLTAGVAHEINNPANFAFVGSYNLRQQLQKFHEFLLALAGSDAPPELLGTLQQRFDEMGESLGAISEGATRIRDLVRDLRTFSRLDEADWKEVAIGDSLSATVNLVRMQYAHQVEIVCDLQANPVLTCWPAQLNQVFMNLIVNACQAIASRPDERKAQEPGRLLVRSFLQDQWLVLEFADNGTGMSESTLQQIFDPFYTTKGVGEGMGMGLSIVLSIIEKHQGKIGVQSTLGQGSRFELRLPLVMPT